MATEFEEVVVEPYALHLQHLAPDRRYLLLNLANGCLVLRGTVGLWLGQRLTVQFAVRAQRHLRQHYPLRRDHVVGQLLGQVCNHLCLPRFKRLLQHQVTHQVGTVHRQHRGFADIVEFQQARFDFAQLYAQATQFDLVIDSPGIFNHAIVAITREVTGAIQARAAAERVGHKPLGGKRRTAVITPRQANTAQIQFAQHTHWRRFQVVVQHVATQVGNGSANGYGVAAFLHAGPVGHVDGGFSRAIQVVQPGLGQFGEHLLLGIGRQRLPTANDALQALA